MCHLVLFMPILGLVVFWFLPFHIAGHLYAVILAFSVVLYVKFMRAMYATVQTGVEPMLGEAREVIETIHSKGRVRLHGETWSAVSRDVIARGDCAEIVSVEGLTLRARKVQDGSVRQHREREFGCAMK
ncbi:MAG: NfeD family protein [Bacteroidota bacterium]